MTQARELTRVLTAKRGCKGGSPTVGLAGLCSPLVSHLDCLSAGNHTTGVGDASISVFCMRWKHWA